MPILNFQARFAEAVRGGTKRQTIRAMRKHPIRPGDMLYLYTGLRRPGAERLRVEPCWETHRIQIWRRPAMRSVVITIDGQTVGGRTPEFESIARRDGFANADELLGWLEETYGFPFVGQIIRW